MPFPNPNLRLSLKQRILSLPTCFWYCTKKGRIKYCRKFIFMIDEWKKPLKDPFSFVKLDHIDSYNLSKCRVNQEGDRLVLVCNFFPSNFNFVFFRFFLLYCPNLFPIELHCLFLSQVPSISSSKGLEGVEACLCTHYSPIHSHT